MVIFSIHTYYYGIHLWYIKKKSPGVLNITFSWIYWQLSLKPHCVILKLFFTFVKSSFTPLASLKSFCLWFTLLCLCFVLFLKSWKRMSLKEVLIKSFCPKIKFFDDLFLHSSLTTPSIEEFLAFALFFPV